MTALTMTKTNFNAERFWGKFNELSEEGCRLDFLSSVHHEMTVDPTRFDHSSAHVFMYAAWDVRKEQGTVSLACLSLITTLDEAEVTRLASAQTDKPKKRSFFSFLRRHQNPFSLTPVILGGIFDVALDRVVSEEIRAEAAHVAAECLGRHPEYNHDLASDLLATFESPSATVRDAVAGHWLLMKKEDPSAAFKAYQVAARNLIVKNPKASLRSPEIGPA